MLLLLATLTALLSAAPEPLPDVVVVCPADYRAALTPWVEHRRAQGHTLAFLAPGATAAELRAQIKAAAAGGGVKFVVLVGDHEGSAAGHAPRPARSVPACLVPAKVNVLFRSEPVLATDSDYADFDDDGLPDAAVGRLSCRTPEQLRAIVTKVLDYERCVDCGPWRRKINFVAGTGDFGPVTDAVIEWTTARFLTEGIPPEFQTSMTFASWRSAYCPDPRQFREAAAERLREGCLFWVYIGHGQRTHLDYTGLPGPRKPILACEDLADLAAPGPLPIALLLACYTGAYDAPVDCLSEEMLRTPGAPVAAIAASRVAMPYAMAVLGTGMMDECFVRRRETVGEILLHAKRSLVAPDDARPNRQLLDGLAAVLSPKPELLAEERREHVRLFNLMGDPLLRVRQPRPVTLDAAREIKAGEKLIVTGVTEVAGRCTVELVCRRDRLTFKAPHRPALDATDAALATFAETYRRANDRRFAAQTLDLPAGRFQAELTVPPECDGACHIWAFAEGEREFAFGSRDLFIRRK